ncbi:MAG: hypothetical protein ACE5LU_09155 [Anaerolineae bacterium]
MSWFGCRNRTVWQLTSLATIVALVTGLVLPAQVALASDLDELRAYAAQMKPLVEEVVDLAREDAATIQEARAGNPDALCDGRLAASGQEMAGLQAQIATVVPPEEAAEIHDRLVASLDEYSTGIEAIVNFCETGKKAQLGRGLLAMVAARLNFGGAIIEFNLLLLQSGLEEFQARYPGSDFEALLQYGAAIGPGYRAWGELIAAEGPAIEAALAGHPEELCNMDVAADIPHMQEIVDGFEAVPVPDAATDVHQLVAGGANAWLEGLRNSVEYCTAEKDWQKAVYLAASLADFGLGTTGFASALTQYTGALQEAWQDLW